MRLSHIPRQRVKGLALLPVGSMEQHGPHLPMGTDCILTQRVGEEVEASLPEIILFPPICYGVSLEHDGFPYVGVTGETFMRMVREVLETSLSSGIRRTVVVNGHGGNEPYLRVVQREFNFSHSDAKVRVVNLSTYGGDLHAGVGESSEIYVIDEGLVDLSSMSSIDSRYREGIFDTLNVREATRDGVADSTGTLRVDPELGGKLLEQNVLRVKSVVLQFLREL